ncbi:hypothetical protein EO244_15340 [Ancylomarina salipaludis]|uniref:Uncharacterized protein n=1 Tax=Ancylomarina salipaludis TaxID=2501299 RepID=A0A4Q1JJA8_9BACT|nr:hypothetical protein [Ancylomarina salipaludis]RXQ88502.1 hypothetical protein EO244_15340 [Ancylomarina salipaludis]
MSWWSNILMAIVSLVDPIISPIIGIVGSVVKYTVSKAKNAGAVFLFDLASSLLPGGAAKELFAGMISDIIETDLTSGVKKTVPYNDIALFCGVCNKDTHYYIKDKSDSLIKCSNCFEKNLRKKINFENKVYILENGLYKLDNKRLAFQKSLYSNSFEKRDSPSSFSKSGDSFKFNKKQ